MAAQVERKGGKVSAKSTLKKGADPLDREFKVLYSSLLQTVGKDSERSVKEKEVQGIVEKLWGLIKAKFLQICRKPAYSRGIQSILKWGSETYRKAIFEKMKNYLVELSIDSHSSKIVEKMYNYGSPEIRKTIRDELLTKFDQLGYSKYGSKVFGHVFSEKRNPSESWEGIKNEILFRILSTGLTQLYTNTEDSKSKSRSFVAFFSNMEHRNAKISVLEHSVATIQRFVDGELLDRPFVHILIWNYIKCCVNFYIAEEEGKGERQDTEIRKSPVSGQFLSLGGLSQEGKSCLTALLDQIMEGFYSLLSTREGVDSLVVLLGFAKAQQRKKILKGIKKDVTDLSLNPVDYILLLRLISTTDDTKILGEVVWSSLISEGELSKHILSSHYPIKLVTYLLVSQVNLRNFTQYEHWALTLESFTSLKSADTRIQEMNRVVMPALENLLFNSQDQESILESLVLSAHGKDFMVALIQYYLEQGSKSSNGTEDLTYETSSYGKAIKLVNHSLSRLISDNSHLLKDNIGHRTFVSILKLINEQPCEISSRFDPFRNTIVVLFEKSLLDLLSSRAVFILVEMVGQNFEQRDFKLCTLWRVRTKEMIKDVIGDCIASLKKCSSNTTGIELLAKYTNLDGTTPNSPPIESVNSNKKQNKRPNAGKHMESSNNPKLLKKIHL